MRRAIFLLFSTRARRSAALILLILSHSVVTPVMAEALPAPQGPVLLKITGNLSLPNVGDAVHLDKEMLEAFPVETFTTHTPWAEGPQTFTGVRLSDLFDAIGAEPESFVAIGLDDYKFTVTDVDIDKYPVIVAYKHNGDYMSVRRLGPLRILFPFDDYPELLTHKNESSSVWQLLEMELR